MKAIVLERPGKLELRDVAAPEAAAPGEALLRVKRVGICGTDLHAYGGNQNFFSYPRIMGHELAVEVIDIGATDAQLDYAVGDLCCVIPYLNCGACIACRRGKSNCCTQMQVLGVHIDGGMRERFSVPVDKLLKAEGVAVEELALVEMLCIGAHAAKRARIAPGENALVIGAGPIGLATAQFAKLAGAEVMVMEVNEKRLDFCQGVLGIDTLIDARGDAMGQVEKALGGELPTLVFDCTGSAKSMHAAFDYVAHGGALALVGHITGDITFSDPHFHSHELTLLASRNATPADFAWVIDCLRAGQINLAPWVTHEATPEGILREFPRWVDPATGVIKAMLRFD
ncbi:MAG: zinc-binding alcohol dehydrogenase family protein [Chloroflexota bacterium]|nr:zinc-binding alcohol dehydrogenase family protein [Chloroflexota bacterium]MDE2910218.1 zinc-binding alcohol dehydrogenase family protein [Chloroflexota bacterium]